MTKVACFHLLAAILHCKSQEVKIALWTDENKAQKWLNYSLSISIMGEKVHASNRFHGSLELFYFYLLETRKKEMWRNGKLSWWTKMLNSCGTSTKSYNYNIVQRKGSALCEETLLPGEWSRDQKNLFNELSLFKLLATRTMNVTQQNILAWNFASRLLY